ncbi:MAG: MFS transporter [Thermosipho sp. (in: Bacteria)]|nr:MFS transporter [Thermosipho sp. (in: thermotogales)]
MVKNRWVILIFITILLIFLNADQMVMSPNIGLIEKEFGIDDSQIGLVASTFTILGALISLLWGYFADKYNRKYLLIFSILVGEIPCFMSAFSQSYSQLFIWRTLTGIGVGASFPIVFSLIGDMFNHKERGKVMAIVGLSITLGNIVGMIIGGFLGEKYGWRLPFILVSVPNFIFALLALGILKEPKRGAAEEGFIDTEYEYIRKITIRDYLKLFKIKTNLYLFLQGIVGTIPWGAIPYFLVEFFKRERGLTAAKATTIFMIFGLGSIFGNLLGGLIGELIYKKNKKLVPITAGLTTILGVFFTIWTFSYNNLNTSRNFIVLLLIGFTAATFDSFTGPNVKMMLLNVNEPQDRGRIFSVFNLTDSLGTGIGKYIGGLLSVTFGSLAIAMNVATYFWIICGIILLLMYFFFENDVKNLNTKMLEFAANIKNKG